MLQKQIHQAILNNCDAATDWFEKKSSKFAFPFYSSYDVRDSGHMIAPVDANIYPAGFNNICPTDKEHSVEIVRKYLSAHYSLKNNKILLLTEEHTGNPYYWENVNSIQNMISEAGYDVELG